MTDPAIPPAPRGLSAPARKLWRMYNAGWQLDDHTRVVLALALECFDRMRQAQHEISTRGLVLKSGRSNPAALVERDCRRDLVKALRALGLTLDPIKAATR
jgi:phage terminase small subunit